MGTRQYTARRAIEEEIDNLREGIGDAGDVRRNIDEQVLVKGNLTPETGQSLHDAVDKAIDPENPLNTPAAKRGTEVLNDIQDLEIKTKSDTGGYSVRDEIEDRNNWLRKKNDYDRWLQEKERSDDEIEKYVQKETVPAIEKVTLNWFERAFLLKRRQFGVIASELDQLVKKKIKTLKGKEIWGELSDQEKKDAEEFFRRGGTVQQLVEAL